MKLTASPRGNVPRGRASRRTAPRLAPYAFVAPATILFALLMILPIGYALFLSVEKSQVSGLGLGAGARRQVFAGLSNYTAGLTDPAFISAVLRVVEYSVILVPVMLGLALLFALVLDTPAARMRRFARVSIFLPFAVPALIGGMLCVFLYLP